MFSSLVECLDGFCNLLTEAKIKHNRIHSMDPLKIATFRADPEIRVLCLPMSTGSAGLNLTQANHLIFLEPSIQKASVSQVTVSLSPPILPSGHRSYCSNGPESKHDRVQLRRQGLHRVDHPENNRRRVWQRRLDSATAGRAPGPGSRCPISTSLIFVLSYGLLLFCLPLLLFSPSCFR